MRYPPIKADRALLWITLYPDKHVGERYAALRALLKQCRLHPLDTTATAELVIVEEVAFRARIEDVRRALGERDVLHLIAKQGERLIVETIEADKNPASIPQRPPWLF